MIHNLFIAMSAAFLKNKYHVNKVGVSSFHFVYSALFLLLRLCGRIGTKLIRAAYTWIRCINSFQKVLWKIILNIVGGSYFKLISGGLCSNRYCQPRLYFKTVGESYLTLISGGLCSNRYCQARLYLNVSLV